MKPHQFFIAFVAAGVLLAGSSRAAITHSEIGDAGELPGSAQSTGSDVLLAIQGTLRNSPGIRDIDLFAIDIFDPDIFSATTVSANTVGVLPEFDTQLFLFDQSGNGVVANDDDPLVPYLSTIPAGSLLGGTPGLYFLAIAEFPDTPRDASDNDIFDIDGDPAVGAGPIDNWLKDLNALVDSGGRYEILLTGAQGAQIAQVIPEPSSLALISGFLALGALRFRLQRRRSR